jgi:isoleucyl-tRNA synthetase
MRYSGEWRTTVNGMGRWIDFDNDYKTMNLSFMESVWWAFKQFWEKGDIYRGLKVMPYSTGCATALPNFETSQYYKEVNDPAITISFKAVNQDYEFADWITTSWTIPSNLILAAHT